MDWLSKFNENSEKVIWVRIHMNLRGWEPFRVNPFRMNPAYAGLSHCYLIHNCVGPALGGPYSDTFSGTA